MRADEFIREEEKLDEVLPLIGIAAKGVAKGVAGAVGRSVGKAAVAGAGAVARGVGGAAKAAGGMLSKGAGPAPTQSNQTMGAPDEDGADADPARAQAMDRAKDQVIKPGANINLPTDGTGGPGEFKVTGMQGDEVEIENPTPAPGEPRRVMYKKDDIKQSMSL